MHKIFRIISTSILFIFVSCDPGINENTGMAISEIDHRLDMVVNRITKGELPRLTEDFLLAGLTLDPAFERRFTNFSGDQIGRYLSAMSLIDNTQHNIDIHDLVKAVITNQRSDGRFGADTLSFETDDIEGPQMALLWGNGRLLTGLLDYYEKNPDRKDALTSAVKLGDFLDGVTGACTQPEIIDRFKTMGALGFICFTQITEGMVKLYNATGNEKYKTTAEKIYPLLPEPGNQHSHGFLNTLRGVVMLYEATRNPIHLAYAEKIFIEIYNSENYMVSGGVPEFFSYYTPSEYPHDEGCSEADFFMLCLQLWKATGNDKYLDRAEYSFMNHMLYNQFRSGDFGHHNILKGFGFGTSPVPGQAWWCCSYHGLQALWEARQSIITQEDNIRKINLFYPSGRADPDITFNMTKIKSDVPAFQILIKKISAANPLIAIRNPYWCDTVYITLNGKEAPVTEKNGYLLVDTRLKQGDKMIFALKPILRLIDEDRNEIDVSALAPTPVRAAMIYGPWLMSVDDVIQTLFMAELSYNNIIYIPSDLSVIKSEPELIPQDSFNPELYLSFTFLKEGTSQTGKVFLRPISEVSFQGPSNVKFWFYFARQK
jgi:DUF1680 family protein